MSASMTEHTLQTLGLSPERVRQLLHAFQDSATAQSDEAQWQILIRHLSPHDPFPVHQFFYEMIYQKRNARTNPGPAWFPSESIIQKTHLHHSMEQTGHADYASFYQWSIQERSNYWQHVIDVLQIVFQSPFQKVVDFPSGIECPRWLAGATFNIVDSCFLAHPDRTAIVTQTRTGSLERISYGTLKQLVDHIAQNLKKKGIQPRQAVAIDMPLTPEAVALYLAIIKIGAHVVGIADSFSSEEIATRLKIAPVELVFTQDVVLRGNKTLPLYQKIVEAKAPATIVIAAGETLAVDLRPEDSSWKDFLTPPLDEKIHLKSEPCNPTDLTQVLFSSGTTGIPKAIPWDHIAPIKAAADGYFHQDIHPHDVVCWPTSLGWMMGPWVIHASFINRATLALSPDSPNTRSFCEFVEQARVSVLGVVPSLVKAWRSQNAVAGLDWTHIKLFSSTGEASNATDMLYLMSQAGYRPVIEYCGGTEIAGGYITGTLLQPAIPATFSTPALGLEIALLDEEGDLSEQGEIALIPPSMGLSNTLLNENHHQIYYANMPSAPAGKVYRRHGDALERLDRDYYRALGRVDDTMNLGGIKISSAEIERALMGVEGVLETAAIAVTPPEGGPSQLIIFVVPKPEAATLDPIALQHTLQQIIKQNLNPLFKIHDLLLIEALPRTSSNKVMRRVLRDQYAHRRQ